MKDKMKNIIKRTADNHADDIAPQLIWNGIEKKLGKKKSRKGFIWWLGVFGFLIIALLLGLFMVNNDADINNNMNASNEELSILISDQILAGNESNIGAVTNESINETVSEKIIRNTRNVGNESKKVNSYNNAIIKSSSTIEITTEDKTRRKSNLIIITNQILTEEADNEPHVQSENKIELVSLLDKGREKLIVSRLESIFFESLETPFRPIENINQEFYSYGSLFIDNDPRIEFLSGIETFGGLFYGTKSISDPDLNYASSRNAFEEFLEQWTTGVRFDIFRVMDFHFQSGLKYSMITDKWSEINEYRDLMEYTYVKSRLVDGSLIVIDSMVVMDSLSQPITHAVEQYNSQRLISIPLDFSFVQSFNKLELGLGFGLDINYQLKDIHVIKDKNNRAIVNEVGGKFESPSFSGNLLLGYRMNDTWSLTSRASFRGLRLSDHATRASLRSNYKLFGLEIGLKRHFGK